MSERCFICGEDNPNVIEKHHLIPRRFGGVDDLENIYQLCANCHMAIEKMYDAAFYKDLEVKKEPDQTPATSIPEKFADKCLKQAPDGWEQKEKVREVYNRFTVTEGVPRMHPAAFGRAINNLDGLVVESGQKTLPANGRMQIYKGIELTEHAEEMLEQSASR